jgi:hypothetical protein
MRVADRPGGVWTMQRRAQVEQIEPRSAGRIQPAYCDWPNAMSIYVTLRRTVRTLPSGRGRVRHAWIARTPARYPTGAGRTGTPSPESPYVPRRFRSRRPDWVRMMRLSAPANRAVHGPTHVVWAEALEGETEATGPRLDPRDGALPMWPAGRGGRGLSSDQPVRWARPGSRDCYLRVTEISGNRRSSDRRRLSPASMARPRPDGRRANAGGRATTRSTRKAARLRSVRCRSAS